MRYPLTPKDDMFLIMDLFTVNRIVNRWGNDSRPRYVGQLVPREEIVDAGDLEALARRCTRPRSTRAYVTLMK